MTRTKLILIGLIVLTLTLTACFATDPTAPTPNPDSLAVTDPPGGLAAAHPLSIAMLRDRTYPGSDFVIEQTLEPGINYNRYIASYLSDGLKIYALLTVPMSERPPTGYPVVIFNHGYIPPDEYRTTERYLAYTDAFARAGYIVVKSDYRGHGSSEGDPESAYTSPGYTVDVLNALAAARRYPDADPNRVGMWGHSMGGYITLRAMVAEQGIRAGVIWAGVVDSYTDMLTTWFRRDWGDRMIGRYGSPQANPDFWNAISANSFLGDLSGPVQIHTGTGDATVPYTMSVRLDEQIRAAGGTSELFLWEGDDHNIATHRDDALLLSVAFMHVHVRG